MLDLSVGAAVSFLGMTQPRPDRRTCSSAAAVGSTPPRAELWAGDRRYQGQRAQRAARGGSKSRTSRPALASVHQIDRAGPLTRRWRRDRSSTTESLDVDPARLSAVLMHPSNPIWRGAKPAPPATEATDGARILPLPRPSHGEARTAVAPSVDGDNCPTIVRFRSTSSTRVGHGTHSSVGRSKGGPMDGP